MAFGPSKGCAMLIVVRRSNAWSACSLGFKPISANALTVARLQMEASTPAATVLSRRTTSGNSGEDDAHCCHDRTENSQSGAGLVRLPVWADKQVAP